MQQKNNQPFFITGTDTGIGKTVCSLVLMQALYQKGHEPFYLKPFQTGCKDAYDTDSDAAFIYRHVAELQHQDPAQSVLFCYEHPKAPYFAAKDEGRNVSDHDLQYVRDIIRKKQEAYSPVLIEGAGGLYVPVTESLMMIDLIERLKAIPVLVARVGLGTINHTLLSLTLLQQRNMTPAAIILVDAEGEATPAAMLQENVEAIEVFSGCRVSGVVGRIDDFSVLHPGNSTLADALLFYE
jgi:dethiobiotin synthetase